MTRVGVALSGSGQASLARSLDHVFCATELQAGEHFYLSRVRDNAASAFGDAEFTEVSS